MGRAGWAVIFDWDGVLVDSSRQHERSWEQLADEAGLVLPADHFQRGFGMKNETIIPSLLGWTQDPKEIRRLSDRKEVLYRDLIRQHGLQPLPGVTGLVRQLAAASVPCAVGSSTPRPNITCVLDHLGFSSSFQAIVSSEDVAQGKPDPDIFLKAAQQLGMPPRRCVVIEDTPVGVQAGRAAGMRVVAVTTTHPASMLDEATRIVASLADLSVDELQRCHQKE